VWDRVGVTDDDMRAAALRAAMADQIERDYPQLSAGALALLRKVPRHRFIPGTNLETAYVDDAVITRRDSDGRSISSISQPSMVAQMLDMLDARPGMKVLEIGAGTGYCAALLAELVGTDGAVTTIDLDADITDEAARNLDATGYSRVTVTCGDGALGDPDGAPWDRILVSVGAWEPSPEWIAQLAPDGKLVMPLALRPVDRTS
jgi:protein-L-isoaspartate(D-aspartate) O-methyltransferase